MRNHYFSKGETIAVRATSFFIYIFKRLIICLTALFLFSFHTRVDTACGCTTDLSAQTGDGNNYPQTEAWYNRPEDRIYINLLRNSRTRANTKVADVHGKVVMEGDALANNGITQLSLYMMGFTKGSYNVTVSDKDGRTKTINLLKD